MMKENARTAHSGLAALAILIPVLILGVAGLIRYAVLENGWMAGILALVVVLDIVMLVGLFMVQPNQARVLQLFGGYAGTVKVPGLRWANPFYTKRPVSLRVRNFESNRLKVNDLDGNPIEIAAVVVWKVVDSAEAVFEVDDYENYVKVQTEAAVRILAMSYPYDAHDEQQKSLRGNPGEIADHLRSEIEARLQKAGVQVIEARISHLAYAPEIAQAMLRRQQASAVIAARQKIVDGSVGMVEMALERLSRQKIVELDEERKAAMVSNLLVVLCSETATQPVVNAGTLHH